EPVTVIQRRLLRREAIPMHRHLLSLRRLRQLALELEPGQCLALVEQLVQRQLAQAEVLPPPRRSTGCSAAGGCQGRRENGYCLAHARRQRSTARTTSACGPFVPVP